MLNIRRSGRVQKPRRSSTFQYDSIDSSADDPIEEHSVEIMAQESSNEFSESSTSRIDYSGSILGLKRCLPSTDSSERIIKKRKTTRNDWVYPYFNRESLKYKCKNRKREIDFSNRGIINSYNLKRHLIETDEHKTDMIDSYKKINYFEILFSR